MIGRSLARVLRTAMVVTLTLLSVEKTTAQRSDGVPVPTPVIAPIRVRAVDDNKTDNWPAGPWKAIPRQDYFDLIGEITRLRSRPRAAWIQTAEYSARIDDTQFRDGRLTLELINNAPGPTAIPLAPLGLAIASLQQDGRPLIWGTTAHRTIVLVAPPGRSTVTGQWSLQGRKVVSLEEFDVRLAPAVQTSLVLDVPGSQRLTASRGQLTQSTNDATRPLPVGHRRFRLQLGNHNRSRLVIDRNTAATPGRPTRLLARQRTSCEIAVNGARIVTDHAQATETWATDHWPILDCGMFLAAQEPLQALKLPHSWQATSDTIAGWIARTWPASRLTLVKSVDLPSDRSPTAMSDAGLIDEHLATWIDQLPATEWVNLRSATPQPVRWQPQGKQPVP